MAGLSPPLLTGLVGRRGRPTFAGEAVGRRRQGGVAGIGVQLGRGVRELSLQLADLLLLPGDLGEGIVAFNLEVPVGRLEFGDALLGVGSLQVKDTATQGAQVQTHIFGELSQRFRIYHANRQHAGILSARLTADYCSAGDRVPDDTCRTTVE